MRIVGGLDIHRRQITFDYLDERSGQGRRGRIAPADRMLLRRWLETNLNGAPAAFAVEACTGWRFVVEELRRAGIQAHLAEPAETAAARGPKRRAKTDRTDARHLRELLGGRAVAGVVDPARPGAGDAGPVAAVQGPAGGAHRLGAAHPRDPAAPRRAGDRR